MNYTKKSWQNYWLILQYHKFSAIAIFLLTMMLAITAAIKVERNYTVNSKIQLEYPKNELINLLATQATFNKNNKDYQDNIPQEDKENPETNFAILTQKVFEQLKISDNYFASLDYDKFIKKLDIQNNSRTGIIEITYSGKELNSSKLVVNSLIEFYRNQHAETHISNIKRAKDKFNQQLAFADKNAKEIASKLNDLLTKYDRNILESKPEYLTNKIKEIEEKITSAKSEIRKIDSKINDLKSRLNLNVTQDTAQQYISVNKNNNFISEITEQLVNYEAEKGSWLTKIESWVIDKERYQRDNAIAPVIKQQYQELLTKNKQAKEQYNKILNQSQQLEFFSEKNIANIKILNPPKVKNNLASWNKEIITANGIGLGFILALVTVLALESKNPSLKTREEISELFNSKILGEIPNLRKSDFHISHHSEPVLPERFVLEAPYSVTCEAYKIVYDNLELTKADKVIKLITVTSSSIEEGKSTFIANLAALTTQLGKKVLVIDSNIQTPKQKAIWHIYSNLGLTNILKKEAEFENVVQSPNLNLDVITAGSMVEDYLSLWESEHMKEFINHIKEKYDLVIFDTPAINLYPDALKISQFTDGIIIVGRIGFTNPQKALEAKELIEQSHQEILGLVINEKFDN